MIKKILTSNLKPVAVDIYKYNRSIYKYIYIFIEVLSVLINFKFLSNTVMH